MESTQLMSQSIQEKRKLTKICTVASVGDMETSVGARYKNNNNKKTKPWTGNWFL